MPSPLYDIHKFYLLGLETSAFVAAIRQRNVKTAKFILNLGNEDPNQQDREGKTALMAAVGAYNLKLNFSEIDFENSTPHDMVVNKWTNENAVKILLEKDADLNVQDNEGRTALMFAAAWGGNGRIVQELLEHGAAINMQDNAGNTALDYAIRYWVWEEYMLKNWNYKVLKTAEVYNASKAWLRQWENEGVVQLLLDNNASVNFFSNESLHTPLIKMLLTEAALSYHFFDYKTPESKLRLIERLISNNTIHRQGHEKGLDALSIAASYSSLDIFKIVLKHSYNLNNQDNSGKTALMKLVNKRYEMKSRLEKLRLLLARKPDLSLRERSYNRTALMLAYNTPELKLLLDHGASVHERSSKGKTALWYTNDENGIRMLVEHRIDVDAQDIDGNTALMSAVYNKNTIKIKALLKYGSNIYIKNRQNLTAISYSIQEGDSGMLRVLLSQDKGFESDEELQDILRYRISDDWIFEDTAEMLKVVFEFREVNIDARDSFGQTLLIKAARSRFTDSSLLKVILNMKPNLDLKDNAGNTALIYLAPHYREDDKAAMISMLIDHGASTTITNGQGKTARDIAASTSYWKNCSYECDDLFG